MRHEYIKNITTLNIDIEKCTGCSMCKNVCPQGVFEIKDGKAVIKHKDYCMECGACVKNCGFKALSVKKGVG